MAGTDGKWIETHPHNFYWENHLRQTLTIVVNTEAARPMSPGVHWIAVQLHRLDDEQISIVYLDSFDAPMDHSRLFDSLRMFFNAVSPQE